MTPDYSGPYRAADPGGSWPDEVVTAHDLPQDVTYTEALLEGADPYEDSYDEYGDEL